MPTLERLGVTAIRQIVTAFRDVVTSHQAGINQMNVYPVPDGDTGTNMARTLDAVVAELEGAAPELEATCAAISHGSLMGARGNSGVILSQILRGLAGVLAKAEDASPRRGRGGVHGGLGGGILGGAQAGRRHDPDGRPRGGGRRGGEPQRPAARCCDVLSAARDAGKDTLDKTPEMLPVLRDAGVVDAGGAGFLLLLDAALHVVDGRPLPEPSVVDDTMPGRPVRRDRPSG